MLELADNMDLKSIEPKARVGSNPTLGTMGSWRSWIARFLDMEEVRGSSPLGPTSFCFFIFVAQQDSKRVSAEQIARKRP